MHPDEKSQKRVKKLFADLNQIAGASDATGGNKPVTAESASRVKYEAPATSSAFDASAASHEMDALLLRIRELEAKLKESEKRAAPVSIYESEELGYAFHDDHVLPVQMVDSPAEDSDKVIQTPLTASGETIGALKIKPPEDRPWTTNEENLANAVAQQVSLQIQNLRLLAAAERARAEAEEATRQFTHKNWETFLDAIHNNERIGYMYDQASVEPFTQPAPDQYDHEESLRVLDQHIGRIFIKGNGELKEEDRAFISAIVKQVGQQVENIRLLADASRARAEAEEATRRLIRQNWETHIAQENVATGFVYDSIKVSPLGSETISSAVDLEHPLIVRGEPIGQLAVLGLSDVSQEARDIAAAIATQASIHLETLRLTEELQRRAQELKELDRLKSAFLANMSHELRTPLNSILGFADVMLEGLDGELTDYMNNDLKLIQKNGQHLLHLINDVLDMAKIESGKMNLVIEKFNLRENIEEVISISSSLANEKGIALLIDPETDPQLEISADGTRLRQVLLNIVNNATKFTEQGSISIRAVRQEDNVLISIKDTGIGIPPDQLEAVFHEFTQIDSSTTRKVGGTGLGLPISRRLIEMHGGHLWAESTGVDGEGATFHIHMPIEAKVTDPDSIHKY